MNKFIKTHILFTLILAILIIGLFYFNKDSNFELKIPVPPKKEDLRRIASIDTMKYSRDVAREKLNDISFDKIIDKQIADIAGTGATHVAIGTPYDEEFLPFLKRWVAAARKYKLKVWFRGNFSGWERWFDYSAIDRSTHMAQTVKFVENNSYLFENGDIFGACNECENGGPGDPRQNGDVIGHREFLIREYKEVKNAFNKIGKKVAANFNSMNGDVARLIMDRQTTRELDGIIVVDHYVSTPQILADDLKRLADKSGGKVVLGEFGVPIVDINGNMTDQKQADWINEAMGRIFQMPEVIGVNYWVNIGGSTNIWKENGERKIAVDVLTLYYKKNRLKTPSDF